MIEIGLLVAVVGMSPFQIEIAGGKVSIRYLPLLAPISLQDASFLSS